MQNVSPTTLQELPSEVWLEIFDKVGPTADIPCVCKYFKTLHQRMITIWAERIVDYIEDCYKQQSPARDIPRGHAVTYDQGKEIIKYFKNKIDAARSPLSNDEQNRYKNASSLSLVVHPESLSTLLPMIDENELVNLLHAILPRHLRTAPRPEQMKALTALTRLHLSGNQLTTLPHSIGKCAALTELFLSNNHLTILPEAIGNISALTWLRLSNNRLAALPDAIGSLTLLTMLDLSGNLLITLPSSISNLTLLTTLDLSGNLLITLPDFTSNLTLLTRLNLSGNSLSTLPDFIGNLTKLTWLNLDNNQLSTLPVSIGNLTALRFCDIQGNSSLTESPQSLSQLQHLRDSGCEVDCDTVVDLAIKTLKQQKFLQ